MSGLSCTQPAARIAYHDTCASSAGPPHHFYPRENAERHANDAQSMCRSSLAHHWQAVAFACGLRRRPANDAQVPRTSSLAHHWHAVVFLHESQRRPANDAQVTSTMSLAHHWQAVRGLCAVTASFIEVCRLHFCVLKRCAPEFTFANIYV